MGDSEPPLIAALAPHYSRFRVTERVLLTGHSHQAWPDVAFEAQQRAWLDAAEFVDDKWDRAAAQAEKVRAGFARLLRDAPDNVALGENTHELVTRWLSALPFRRRHRIVTTTGEFHSARRQLDRLAEEGVALVKIEAHPIDGLVDRMAKAIDDATLAVVASSVLFETAEIVPHLDHLARVCHEHGASLLIDAYHHLNVIPFDVRTMGLEGAFVTGGGYKYCQLGEGNCFLRVPPGRQWRPVLTGWYAEFAAMNQRHRDEVVYPAGAEAFAGATYDPTSHYRAAAVFDFHESHGLTADRLRTVSLSQVALLERAFDGLDMDPSVAHVVRVPAERRGGFLAIRTGRASDLVHLMRQAAVFADARGDILRLGPAPYVSDDQLHAAIAALGHLLT
jgi:kynureninase